MRAGGQSSPSHLLADSVLIIAELARVKGEEEFWLSCSIPGFEISIHYTGLYQAGSLIAVCVCQCSHLWVIIIDGNILFTCSSG